MRKNFTIILLFLVSYGMLRSQDTMYIYNYGTLVDKYAVEKIDSIHFTGSTLTQDTLNIHILSGNIEKYATIDIDSVTFYCSKESIADCGFSDEYEDLPNLIKNGGFEDSNLGVATYNEFIGLYWYASGCNLRQNVEITNTSNSPAQFCEEFGNKIVKIRPNDDYLRNSLEYSWQLQISYIVDTVEKGHKFQFMGKIWSDISGRYIGISTDDPYFFVEMSGKKEYSLNKGWNEWSITVQHDQNQVDLEHDNKVRCILEYGYIENEGVTFYVDDFKLLDLGPKD